jgi:hypothetical protein
MLSLIIDDTLSCDTEIFEFIVCIVIPYVAHLPIFSSLSNADIFLARKLKNKNRPRVRGSSGNWEPDKLTLEEIQKYNRDMGFSSKVQTK